MPTSRIFKDHNATIAVTANAEVLFPPGGQVHGWTRRLGNAIQRGAVAEAPTNKRPRWGHYGKPLKGTMSSQVGRPRGGRHAGLRVYASVGSSAPHAAYVDQGTGVFNGGSPWKAKILPPYTVGGASLYEHTWRPGGPGTRRVAPVMIKGQPGQFFFDKGLKRGFQQMRMRSYQRPGVDPRMGDILRTWPKALENFAGNTPADSAFIGSLTEWRAWRDEAWNAGKGLGRGGGIGSKAQERFRQDAREAREARAQEKGGGREALAASRAAAERRRRAQIAEILAKEKAKSLAKKRREEAEAAEREELAKRKAARALREGNASMERAALEFFEKIRQGHPDARFGQTTLADGVAVYQVWYTVGGETVRQRWAYGYDV